MNMSGDQGAKTVFDVSPALLSQKTQEEILKIQDRNNHSQENVEIEQIRL